VPPEAQLAPAASVAERKATLAGVVTFVTSSPPPQATKTATQHRPISVWRNALTEATDCGEIDCGNIGAPFNQTNSSAKPISAGICIPMLINECLFDRFKRSQRLDVQFSTESSI
jgi:hypothetical protein